MYDWKVENISRSSQDKNLINNIFLSTDDGLIIAKAKWDGCIDIDSEYDDRDYQHICELKREIDLLTSLYEKLKSIFPKEDFEMNYE